jgi:exodeoxyribonuclease V alpha subunit
MNESLQIPDYLVEAFPTASADLLDLFAAATDNAGLASLDFHTIHDLLELSGYQQSASLQALLLVMFLALEEGSLCVEVSEASLLRRLGDLVEPAAALNWTQRILSDLAGGFPELIGRGPDDGRPLVLWQEAERRYLYFQKYLRHDLVFCEAMKDRFGHEPAAANLDKLRPILDEVLTDQPLHLDGVPLQLDANQRRALGLSLVRNFAIISGGPGTGKTSIILTLLRCLVRQGVAPDRIALAAPTGRAAQRMTDSLRAGLRLLPDGWADGPDAVIEQVAAQTLHRLLHFHPVYGTFGRHVENPVPADVVIVDEVSMVGLELMSRLLQAVRPGTRLVLLGDKDQLPSVEAGAVLASLMPENGTPHFSAAMVGVFRCLFADAASEAPPTSSAAGPCDYLAILDKNYRSQPGIRAAARAINSRETDVVGRLPVASLDKLAELERQGGCWFLPQAENNRNAFRKDLEHWVRHQYADSAAAGTSYQELLSAIAAAAVPDNQEPLHQLFAILGRARLLTLVREGPWGCEDINRFFDQQLRSRWDPDSRGLLFAGAPVLITRNDPVRQLYNGDVGIAVRGKGGSLRVVFPRPAGFESFAGDALPPHELGFALTVHKAQGSEYGQVLLVVPPTGGRRLLSKEMIYTAITRAKQLAIICSTPDVLRFAIGRRIVRESGLSCMR